MLTTKELVKLMKLSVTADKNAPTAYSFGEETFTAGQIDEAVRVQLHELAGTYSLYRENKNTIFSLIEQVIDEVLPARVLEQYGQFAEIKTVAQGDKPIFRLRITNASKMRAKKNFVTRVGLAGVYETFKLDGKVLEVAVTAYGGAAQIGLEEFLDGRITFADVLDVVMLGLDEAIYKEIARALIASISNMQAANKYAGAFAEDKMDSLLAVADAYGQSTIYCSYEFAAKMIPQTGWISDEMRNQKWNVGYLANYKGHNVIILPNSFEDDTNAVKVIDPSYAWIIPAGADKPVKIAFEGDTIVQDFANRDGSREVQVYKKIGVGVLINNSICSYESTEV